MEKRVGMEASIAIAEAVGLCDVDIVAAYPITPQTHIVEHLSEMVAEGELDAGFIPVESEHSAMSVCCGTSATGARTYTATSSQGLALMHEILFIASALRLPDRHVGGQPRVVRSAQYLERSLGHHDRARQRLGADLRRKRPGGA